MLAGPITDDREKKKARKKSVLKEKRRKDKGRERCAVNLKGGREQTKETETIAGDKGKGDTEIQKRLRDREDDEEEMKREMKMMMARSSRGEERCYIGLSSTVLTTAVEG